MVNTQQFPSVFEFLDAREFLRHAYTARKRLDKRFSHRYIAKEMGAGSSSFFKDVLGGRAHLNPDRAAGFARLFDLSAREAGYFELLAQYGDASEPEDKERLLKLLTRAQGAGEEWVLDASETEYLQKWYYAAIREMLTLIHFTGDYEDLASRLEPSITPAEARDAVQLLLKLKVIRRTHEGRYIKADKVPARGIRNDPDKVRSGLLATLELARRALDAHPAEIRPFSALTISVSRDALHDINERLRAFRRDIIELVSRDPQVDRLYQLNMQLFPVSVPPRRKPARRPSETRGDAQVVRT